MSTTFSPQRNKFLFMKAVLSLLFVFSSFLCFADNPTSGKTSAQPGLIETQLIPDPTTSETMLKTNNNITQIEIYNLTGAIIQKIKGNGSKNLKISTSALKAGIYTMRIETSTGNEYQKLVIQK
jgi:hypothetical protein